MNTPDKPSPLDGGEAVGAYLRVLRDAAGLTTAEVGKKLGSDTTQVWRIEKWKSDARSTALFKFIEVVGGDVNDVALLINNPAATKDDGERLARLRLARR